MTNRVIDRDFGMADLAKRIRSLGATITVGIHAEQADSGDYDEDVSVVEVGFWNEFGTEDGVVPERSWLRSTMDENRAKYADRMTRIARRVVSGSIKAEAGLALLAAEMESDTRNKVRDLKEPANKPSTIAKKGSSNPLIDNAFLRRAIRAKVQRKG